MYHHMNAGWNWIWMIPMMLIWIIVLGAVVYAAVRIALQRDNKPPLKL